MDRPCSLVCPSDRYDNCPPSILSENHANEGSICDIQENFRKHIHQFDRVVNTTTKLIRFARILDLPVFVTTQNAPRLGPTVSEITGLLQPDTTSADGDGDAKPLTVFEADKKVFSMAPSFPTFFHGDDATGDLLPKYPGNSSSSSPTPVILVGIETHICIMQTALDMLEHAPPGREGRSVWVVADGVSSCNPVETRVALDRLRHAGAIVTTSESLMYECMRDAQRPEFRKLAALVKQTSQTTRDDLGAMDL